MNWEAISALATFTAVLVALWPIWRDELRRRAQARNLRVRLLAQLTVLRLAVSKRFTTTASGGPTAAPLSDREAEPIRILETLMAQTEILEPEEHGLVAAAYVNLAALRALPRIESGAARNVMAVIDQAIARLQRGRFLRSKMPTLPWSEEEKQE